MGASEHPESGLSRLAVGIIAVIHQDGLVDPPLNLSAPLGRPDFPQPCRHRLYARSTVERDASGGKRCGYGVYSGHIQDDPSRLASEREREPITQTGPGIGRDSLSTY
jgi:hypothetical protein